MLIGHFSREATQATIVPVTGAQKWVRAPDTQAPALERPTLLAATEILFPRSFRGHIATHGHAICNAKFQIRITEQETATTYNDMLVVPDNKMILSCDPVRGFSDRVRANRARWLNDDALRCLSFLDLVF